MNKALTITIGFVHDWAAGCWAATVLGVYWLNRQKAPGELGSILFDLKKQFFYFGIACVIVVFATGAGRTFTYVDNVYGEDAEKVRRKMLMIKHIFLLTVFGAGIFWQYTMVYR
jgi:putative copper export protein